MFKEFIKNNLNGILGTVIFHLALVIVFMIIKISDYHNNYKEYIVIEFPEPEVQKVQKKNIDLSEIIPEIKQISRKNVAVNVAENFRKEISTEEYIKKLKDELNIHDPEDGWQQKLEEKYKIKDEKKEEQLSNPDIRPEETNVTYYIKNRFARYIHIPVYKCKGSATIVLNISVDIKGQVVNSAVDAAQSNSTDECFISEAMDAARRSRFNADYNAPARQKGIITYKFVAQ